MDAGDLEFRNLTYAKVVELGRVPAAAEIAAAAGREPAEVIAGWRRLHHQQALVLNAATDEIRMANPFSGVPTAYRVHAADRWWYANCAWDAFGICAALDVDGQIETSCPGSGEPLSLAVRGQRPDDERLLFHCLVWASARCRFPAGRTTFQRFAAMSVGYDSRSMFSVSAASSVSVVKPPDDPFEP